MRMEKLNSNNSGRFYSCAKLFFLLLIILNIVIIVYCWNLMGENKLLEEKKNRQDFELKKLKIEIDRNFKNFNEKKSQVLRQLTELENQKSIMSIQLGDCNANLNNYKDKDNQYRVEKNKMVVELSQKTAALELFTEKFRKCETTIANQGEVIKNVDKTRAEQAIKIKESFGNQLNQQINNQAFTGNNLNGNTNQGQQIGDNLNNQGQNIGGLNQQNQLGKNLLSGNKQFDQREEKKKRVNNEILAKQARNDLDKISGLNKWPINSNQQNSLNQQFKMNKFDNSGQENLSINGIDKNNLNQLKNSFGSSLKIETSSKIVVNGSNAGESEDKTLRFQQQNQQQVKKGIPQNNRKINDNNSGLFQAKGDVLIGNLGNAQGIKGQEVPGKKAENSSAIKLEVSLASPSRKNDLLSTNSYKGLISGIMDSRKLSTVPPKKSDDYYEDNESDKDRNMQQQKTPISLNKSVSKMPIDGQKAPMENQMAPKGSQKIEGNDEGRKQKNSESAVNKVKKQKEEEEEEYID